MRVSNRNVANYMYRVETMLRKIRDTDVHKMPTNYANIMVLKLYDEFIKLTTIMEHLVHSNFADVSVSKVNEAKICFYFGALEPIMCGNLIFMDQLASIDEEKRMRVKNYISSVYEVGQLISNTRYTHSDNNMIADVLARYEQAGAEALNGSTPYQDDIFSFHDTVHAIFKDTPYWSDVVSA